MATAFFEAAPQLLQRGGFPGACRPTNVHGQISGIENKFDGLFLLGAEEGGISEFMLPT
ncbi:MAG: hypothetical protein WBE55_04130 [Candidatus Sulfotelmatobacter sp.]